MSMRALLFGALCCCALAATGAAPRAHEYRLDNGLRLIVQEDHRAPLAVVQVWYRVGSAYEHDGITGVSHALEHMMFKNTKELGVGEFSRIVAARGGRENAFTSDDYTAYYQEWSAENVELSFKLEADRMRNLIVDDAEFAKEINVVLEERRLRTDDNPQALAYEAARATAYQTSPYRYPVIGWEADIKNMSADDLRAWYQRWYGPNNATVVVVGDVDPQAVHALAQRHFGPLAASDITPPKPRPEVAQSGTKRVTVKSATAQVPLLLMAYKAPALPVGARSPGVEDWEIYALDVLAETLDGDDSARLARSLVRGREIAAEVDAGYSSTSALETLFYFSAVPRAGTTLAELEGAIVAEIENLQKEPPSADELERIKTQVVADDVFERDSMSHQAIIIGSLASVGLDWRLKDGYVERIKAVTREQVLAVAAKYLHADALTVAYLMPEAAP
jgi:zinc protease